MLAAQFGGPAWTQWWWRPLWNCPDLLLPHWTKKSPMGFPWALRCLDTGLACEWSKGMWYLYTVSSLIPLATRICPAYVSLFLWDKTWLYSPGLPAPASQVLDQRCALSHPVFVTGCCCPHVPLPCTFLIWSPWACRVKLEAWHKGHAQSTPVG